MGEFMKKFHSWMLAVGLIAFALGMSAQQPASPDGQGMRGQGMREGRGAWGGSGIMGTVTAVAADHLTVKSEDGPSYTVHFSANTRFLHQSARPVGDGGGRMGPGGTPPQQIQPSDIKVGDYINAMGELDAKTNSVGAVFVLQVNPEAAKQMREMRANFGKTWLMGKVTAINGVTVTIDGQVDHAAHTFTADENTTFRKRRDPVTLADLQVGDMVRAEGAIKNGAFLATTVSVMGAPGGPPPTTPRSAPPQQ
jgi:preprotein translocase subunit YajC